MNKETSQKMHNQVHLWRWEYSLPLLKATFFLRPTAILIPGQPSHMDGHWVSRRNKQESISEQANLSPVPVRGNLRHGDTGYDMCSQIQQS